ncbi:MAG TPA: flagellar assembly protein FliH [Pseudomonas sp.]|jgi:flagellar assembly protein FliH|nr:flagellar assembly protein FliH [Pseudomonas sp.]
MQTSQGEYESDLIRASDLPPFERWMLPSFDPLKPVVEPAPQPEPEPEIQASVEEVPVETVQPITLEELEAIRQEAYNEGFSTGEKDGFHAGQLRARQDAELRLNEQLARLEQLMGHLLEPIAEQDQALELALVDLVAHVSREVIQRELHSDSSQLQQILSEALGLLPMGAGNLRIHVNPQDFELVKALRERHEESWKIVEDSALEPGGCRVESQNSLVDATVETRLKQALAQLFEHKREQRLHPPAPDLTLDLPSLEQPDAP